MSRRVNFCLFAILLSTCAIAQSIDDDAEFSGDYEPAITSTVRASVQRGAKKQPPTAPPTTVASPTRRTKATTTKSTPAPVKLTSPRARTTTTRASTTTTTKRTTTSTTPKPSTTLKKTPDLQNDINDFLELIPADEIKEKVEEYYRNDIDVQHICDYIASKEFTEMRKHLLDLADVKDVLLYMHRKGCNLRMLARKVGNRIGFNKLKLTRQPGHDGTLGTNTTIGGLNGLMEEILATLPQDEIFVMFFDKLDKSVAFKALVEAIGNPEFVRKYNVLWNSKELHSATAQLKKHKIDIPKIIQIFQNYFFFGAF